MLVGIDVSFSLMRKIVDEMLDLERLRREERLCHLWGEKLVDDCSILSPFRSIRPSAGGRSVIHEEFKD